VTPDDIQAAAQVLRATGHGEVAAGLERILADPAAPARKSLGLPSRRGGARHADARAARDAAIRAYATLQEPLHLEAMARQVIAELSEYQARGLRNDISQPDPPADPRRRLLFEAASTGLPVPRQSRMKEILRQSNSAV
jgi:hypothetical protein